MPADAGIHDPSLSQQTKVVDTEPEPAAGELPRDETQIRRMLILAITCHFEFSL